MKPLAYWRNERCVYGGSPSQAQIEDGARFPLNSIKEIIRTDEVEVTAPSMVKGKGKARHNSKQRGQQFNDDTSDSENSGSEDWEKSVGVIKGRTAVWDPEAQAPLDQEEEAEIAYAPASMTTRDVAGSALTYAKLLSLSIFGAGVVDLPSGGVKKPKNSRKMHMCFFVTKGRVKVRAGPGSDEDNAKLS